MKKLIPVIISTILMIWAVSVSATIHTVVVSDFVFTPAILTVTVGDTIRWTWSNGVHTTTSTSVPSGAPTWNANIDLSNNSFDYEVTVAGSYSYVCTPHAPQMAGSFTATGSLGVASKNLNNSNLKVYPNPVQDQASLMISAEKSQKATLSIYDLLGNQVKREEISLKQGVNTRDLHVVDIMPGIYFVEIRYENKAAAVRRFVKSR